MGHEKLINAVKKIMENEMELGEMARKPFNNTLTEKGKADIKAAVQKMIADDKEKGTKNHENFAFKALHFLAKQKVGEPVLTTDIQKAAGCKFPQPINKLLSSLVASGFLERASSHVEPEKGEPKPKGRPKGPEKEKVEKAPKLGGLDLKKPAPKSSAAPEDDETTRTLAESNLEELEAELNEGEETMNEEEVNEESVESIAKSLVAKFGVDGNKEGGSSSVDENSGEDEIYEKKDESEEEMCESNPEPLNEVQLTMKYRAGLINDTQFAEAKRKLIK